MARIVDWEAHIGRRLKLRDLYVFFIVIQSGSLARAAARLRVSQPAVSQLIADLEHVVGARLFDRTSRGVSPTIYGQALLERGRAAFDELKEAMRHIEFLSDPAAGEVKIGCQEAIAAILPPVVEDFCLRYPNIMLGFDEEAVDRFASKLRDRTLDFVLQHLRVPPHGGDPYFDGLHVEVLFNDQLVVAAGAHSKWTRRRKLDLAELADEPWILATPDSWNNRILTQAFRKCGLPLPKMNVRTFSTHLRSSLLGSGRFIATFPRSVVDFYAHRFGLKVLPIELPAEPWPVAMLTLKNRSPSPVARLFMDHLRKSIAHPTRSAANDLAR